MKKTYEVWLEDGRQQHINSDVYLPLAMMQKIVGGYIEVHQLGKTAFIMDEEGKLKNRKSNPAFPAFFGTVITTQNGMQTEGKL